MEAQSQAWAPQSAQYPIEINLWDTVYAQSPI